MNRVSNTDSVSGIILAGGTSSRLGQDKALIKVAGLPLVERVAGRLRSVVTEVVLVTNTPERFAFLELTTIGDIHRGIGVLGGLHAGMSAICTEYGLVVGCDMPFLNTDLLCYMISLLEEADSSYPWDVVMPRIGKYYEPLHAIYAKRCLPTIEQSILSGQRRILPVCADMHIRYVREDEIALYDPHYLSFFNVNTLDDLKQVNEMLKRGTYSNHE